MFQSRISRPANWSPLAEEAITGVAAQNALASATREKPWPTCTNLTRPPSRCLAGFEAARTFFTACFDRMPPTGVTSCAAFIDRRAHCIHFMTWGGKADIVRWPTRNILIEAARTNCAGLVMASALPDDAGRPSSGERDSTVRLSMAADAIGVTLVDHLIFAAGGWRSFRRMGLL